ncbi:MAG: hypothetical protein A2045_07680 [Rhodocyclales bacterium GWA2_65_20]|nr:MAG: hypothetical protein A2045_07680 [Rhodocyclales bacterium GWA2_65_20]
MRRPGTGVTSPRGFTLTELAVVLVIIALLIGGMMVPLSAQQDMRNRQDTDKALANIRDAILGFAVVNGYLPCPASPTVQTGTGGATCPGAAGCEARTGTSCTSISGGVSYGVMPWATLGLPETDSWGNRYTYAVTATFSDSGSKFSLSSTSNIDVYSAAPPGGTPLASNGLPVIAISHGKNGFGAYTPQGTQQSTANAASDETENFNGNADFVSNTAIDDQLMWISPGVLMNRMVTAGKLP